MKTPQFWLIWWVLCLNVTAGIGVLGQASAHEPGNVSRGIVTAELRGGWLRRPDEPVQHGRPLRLGVTSDYIGRRNTYFVFMVLGFLLYCTRALHRLGRQRRRVRALLPGHHRMYGGGFATVPAYLADMFGTRYVGAIHGRLMTAWSAAGVVRSGAGELHPPVQVDHGVPKATGLQHHHVHHGGVAGDRLHLQLHGQGRQRALPHEGQR